MGVTHSKLNLAMVLCALLGLTVFLPSTALAADIVIHTKDDNGNAITITVHPVPRGKEKGDDDITVHGPGTKTDRFAIHWISTDANGVGGWTGVGSVHDPVTGKPNLAGSASIKIHCPDRKAAEAGDKPSITITRRKKGGEGAEKSGPYTITEEEQTAMNDHFKDPSLPKEL